MRNICFSIWKFGPNDSIICQFCRKPFNIVDRLTTLAGYYRWIQYKGDISLRSKENFLVFERAWAQGGVPDIWGYMHSLPLCDFWLQLQDQGKIVESRCVSLGKSRFVTKDDVETFLNEQFGNHEQSTC